jgi:hypothetical protein
LIRYGFVKDYTVWKFHGEAEDLSAGASRGNSSTTIAAVNAEEQPSAVAASGHDTAPGDNVDRDYITMDDLLEDMADDDDINGDGGELAGVMEPEDAELFEELANRLDHDDVLFGRPRWLENFREMKQATIDPPYKDCPKQWTAPRFNL